MHELSGPKTKPWKNGQHDAMMVSNNRGEEEEEEK